MRRLAVLAALALAGAAAVLTWAILAERRHEEGAPEALHSFGPIEVKANMPKTQVPGENLSASFTFRHAIWPGMDGSGGYEFSSFTLGCPLIYFQIRSNRSVPGEYTFIVDAAEPLVGLRFTYEVPASADDIYWIEIPLSVVVSGSSATRLTSSTVPIGEKGATHAKEHVITEEWFVPAGTQYTVTVGDQSGEFTTTSDIATALSLQISGETLDCDDWSSYLVGVKYAMSIEHITFGAVQINTTGYTARTWGETAASENKLWVEGFGGSSIGFWCSEAFYNGAYVYNNYPGGTITAPLSFDFSPIDVKWMSGASANTVACVCTGLRKLSTQEDVDEGRADRVGQDIGPWTGTVAELKALGRVTQKYGCYYW